MKKKLKSVKTSSMSKPTHEMKMAQEMEACNCGSADCASCGGCGCGGACGGACSGMCGGACYGGYSHGSGVWGMLKYAKLVVGLVLLASALSPQTVSTQMAVGLLGAWIVFKSILKMKYCYV